MWNRLLVWLGIVETVMVTCSQCGRQKRDVNHWFLFWTERQGERGCFTLFDLDPAMQREPTVQKICGLDCLVKAVYRATERQRIAV